LGSKLFPFRAGNLPTGMSMVAPSNGDLRHSLTARQTGIIISRVLATTALSTSTTLADTPSPAVAGETVTVSATVTSAQGTPPGVMFFNIAGQLSTTVPLSNIQRGRHRHHG
jgi:hypothetical protein